MDGNAEVIVLSGFDVIRRGKKVDGDWSEKGRKEKEERPGIKNILGE